VSLSESARFIGIRTFMRLPLLSHTAGTDFFVVGIPFDTGASFRVGARFGPAHIREHSLLLRPYHPDHDLDIFEHCSGVDVGDLVVEPGFIEASYTRIQEQLEPLLGSGSVPLCLGGDHSVSLPVLRALHARHGRLGLLHFDAHSDTISDYWGHPYFHGTMFRRAVEEHLLDPRRVVQVGLRGPGSARDDLDFAREAGFSFIRAPEVHRRGTESALDRVRQSLGPGPVYLSFDIDCFDPAYAPGTGTPEVAGLTPPQALDLVRGLEGANFVGFDVTEVLPAYDPAGITGLLAANLVWEFMALVATRKKNDWWFHEFRAQAQREGGPLSRELEPPPQDVGEQEPL
jgi:agmatinase